VRIDGVDLAGVTDAGRDSFGDPAVTAAKVCDGVSGAHTSGLEERGGHRIVELAEELQTSHVGPDLHAVGAGRHCRDSLRELTIRWM
jgi:hypothetical protein